MSNNQIFCKYLNNLIDYQAQLSPDNKLCTDYIILYDYLMDLLENDNVIGEFVVRQKLQASNMNGDVLIDLTKMFEVNPLIRDPFLCLTLGGIKKKPSEKAFHPFCNEKLSIIPRNIKKQIWLALCRGMLTNGSFVRGSTGDIYELNLSVNDPYDSCIRLNVFCDNISLNINLRILIKYCQTESNEPSLGKQFPNQKLYEERLAKLPKHLNSPFEVCIPHLEYEMQQKIPNFVVIMRLLNVMFKNNKKLWVLYGGFLESVIYSEFMRILNSKKSSILNEYIFKGVLIHIRNALATKKFPCFWDEKLNLMKSFENESLALRAYEEFQNLFAKFSTLKNKESLNFDEFFDFFDLKMEPCSYEVDQFGIFKTY